MKKMRRIFRALNLFGVTLGILGLIFALTHHAAAENSQASKEENTTQAGIDTSSVDAVIEYDAYKKTERQTYTCTKKGDDRCNSIQSHYVEVKVGDTTRKNLLKTMVNEIPGVGFLREIPLEQSSRTEETLYKKWWYSDKEGGGGRYGVESCTKEHRSLYAIRSMVSMLSGKVFKSENKKRELCKGPRGNDSGWYEANDEPDIEVRPYKGRGETVSPTEGMSTRFSIVEDSKAMLKLTGPAVQTVLPSTMKEVFKELPGDLIKGAMEDGIARLAPDGGLVTSKGVAILTSKAEDIILKNNPSWLVPLSVKVFELIPSSGYSMFDTEEKQVPCQSVTVANKHVDANCHVSIPLSKKKQMMEVTPKTNVNYYRYEINVVGSPVKQAQVPASDSLAFLSSILEIHRAYAEGLQTDENGFLVIPGWDDKDLPLENEQTQDTPILPLLFNVQVSSLKLSPGSTVKIEWRSSGISKVNIDLLNARDEKKVMTIATGVANGGNYSWRVPSLGEGKYMFQVSSADNSKVSNFSSQVEVESGGDNSSATIPSVSLPSLQETQNRIVRKLTTPQPSSLESNSASPPTKNKDNKSTPAANIIIPSPASAISSLNPALKNTQYTSTETTEYECADKNPECGSAGILKQTIEKNWLGNKYDTSEDPTVESTRKVTTVFTPRYGGKTCVTTEHFIRGPSGGKTAYSCTGKEETLAYSTVPTTDVTKRTGGGIVSETNEGITKKYSVNEKTTTLLSIGGDSTKKYGFHLQADVYYAKVLRPDPYIDLPSKVPCAKVKIAGQTLDNLCKVKVVVPGNSSYDITPQVDTPYYWSHVELDPLSTFTEETSRGSIPYSPSENPPKVVSGEPTGVRENLANTKIDALRTQIQSVLGKIQSVRGQIDVIRRRGTTPPPLTVPPASNPQLNTLPSRAQLGDISEILRGLSEWIGEAVR